jgi:hypothetical protein
LRCLRCRNKTLFLSQNLVPFLCEVMRRLHEEGAPQRISNPNVALRYALVSAWNLSFLPEGAEAVMRQKARHKLGRVQRYLASCRWSRLLHSGSLAAGPCVLTIS